LAAQYSAVERIVTTVWSPLASSCFARDLILPKFVKAFTYIFHPLTCWKALFDGVWKFLFREINVLNDILKLCDYCIRPGHQIVVAMAYLSVLPLSDDCCTLYWNILLLEGRVRTQDILIMLIS